MDVKLHQIYFQPGQLSGIDPAFLPYDNSQSTNADYREFYVFRKEYARHQFGNEEYLGYVSWKFQKKTGISGQRFIEDCKANPGYDVYFINPFPFHLALGNIWQGGEQFHAGMTELVQSIFRDVGYNIDLHKVPNSMRLTGYCNFWAGNKKFWEAYMAFCLPVVEFIETKLDPVRKQKLFTVADKTSGASYFAYILERMFTTFLWAHPEVKSHAYRYHDAEMAGRFTQEEIMLYRELWRLEDEHPDVEEPLCLSPSHRLALHYYKMANWNVSHVRPLIRNSLLWIWNSLPFKQALKRNMRIRLVLEKCYQALRAQ